MKKIILVLASTVVAGLAQANENSIENLLCPNVGDAIEAVFCESLEKKTTSPTCQEAATKAAVEFNLRSIGNSFKGPIQVESVKTINEDESYQVTYINPLQAEEIYMPFTMNVYVSTGANSCWAVSVDAK